MSDTNDGKKIKSYMERVTSHIKEVDENCEIYNYFPLCLGDTHVVVISHNEIEVNKNCLKYLIENCEDSVKITWLDNGSTDGTADFLKEEMNNHPNSKLFLSKTNLGVIGGRNLAVQLSENDYGRGAPPEYTIFLDNDQYVGKGWLEQHLSFMNDNKYDVIGVEAWQMNDSFMPKYQASNLNESWSYLSGCALTIRRNVIDKIGWFDEMFNPAYFEDPDYCFRALDNGFKLGWNTKSKIVHMSHSTLGKFENGYRHKLLVSNLAKFRKKWAGHDVPRIIQKV